MNAARLKLPISFHDQAKARAADASRPEEMPTPDEQESLRQHAKELNEFARKAFAHLRPKPKVD